MKKILLIGFIIFCIFQLIIMAAVIDIGDEVIDREYSTSADVTRIVKDNPANANGKITTVEIWAYEELAGCKVAIFTQGEANVFTTRDYETVDNGNGAGVVLAGSKQTFIVDLDVVEGDYIGIYWTAGKVELDLSGAGLWYVDNVDHIPCEDVTFSFSSGVSMSLGGTGATPGWPHKWNTKTISKWNTKEFTKWNGLE